MLQSRPSSCKPVYIAGKAFSVANPLRQEAGGKATPRDSLPLGLFCCYGYTWVHGYSGTPVDGYTHMGIHCRQGLLGRSKGNPRDSLPWVASSSPSFLIPGLLARLHERMFHGTTATLRPRVCLFQTARMQARPLLAGGLIPSKQWP